MEHVDEELVFPPHVMQKIKDSGVISAPEISPSGHEVAWFCIESIQKRTTKNKKVLYRMKIFNEKMERCWLRVWSEFEEEPMPYSMWIAEIKSSKSWVQSTSVRKMRQLLG